MTVISGPERRRRWSAAEREEIVLASFAPGAVVAEVARQFDVSTSLIYKWRRDAQQPGAMFVPAVMAEGEGAVVQAAPVDVFDDGPGDPSGYDWWDNSEHCCHGARSVGPGGAAGAAMNPVRSDVRVWLDERTR